MRKLLSTNTWDEINVQTLCDRANVSRSTFYSHFKNKDDLLDSLLCQFEKAMLAESNARSVKVDGKFRFLPLLLNHVRENHDIFAKNNNSIGGYPISSRFKRLVTKLVEAELKSDFRTDDFNPSHIHFISGGIYSALVHWCERKEQSLHLKLLDEIDELNARILSTYL